MIQHVSAIFENGVLRPLGPLDLRERDLVSLAIEKVGANGRETQGVESTFFELLDEVGLIGYVKDAPSDLSANPKHLEGFGKSGE
jgi:predicted DNA-binding antitoxin AbrB/MazE fold protein